MNHPAEEASHYLRYLCAGEEPVRLLVDAFYANALHEAMGFFGSKIVNHKRKCTHEPQFRELLDYFNSIPRVRYRGTEREIALLTLEHKKMEKRKRPMPQQESVPHKTEVFLGVTHALGYMLGDRMFYAVMGHKLRRSVIKKMFEDPWRKEGRALEVYMDLVERLRSIRIPKRM